MQHYLYVWLLFACICSPDTCHTVASCSNLDYFGTVYTVSRKKGNQMIIGALRSWAECVMASNKWVRELPSHTDSWVEGGGGVRALRALRAVLPRIFSFSESGHRPWVRPLVSYRQAGRRLHSIFLISRLSKICWNCGCTYECTPLSSQLFYVQYEAVGSRTRTIYSTYENWISVHLRHSVARLMSWI